MKIDTTIKILQDYSHLLEINSIVGFILRWIGFFIIKLLYMLTSIIEKGVNAVFSLADFFKAPEVESFINSFKPIFIPILIGSFIYIGYSFVFQNKAVRNRLLQNIFISVIVILGLPMIISNITDISNIGINSIFPEDFSISSRMIKDNITDILLYDENEFSDGISFKNNLSEENILRIDPIEVVNPKDSKNKNVFDSKLKFDKNGNPVIVSLANSWYDFFWKEAYYRYNIDFVNILISLITLALVFVFTLFKICKIYYELAIHRFLALIFSYSDIATGVRLKKILQNIFMSILTLFFTVVLLRFYIIGVSYSTSIETVFIRLIFLITISIATITGPDLVEKILGIDIGSSDVAKGMATAYYGIQTATGISKGLGGIAKSGLGLVSKGIKGSANSMSTMAGVGKGLYDNMKYKSTPAPSPKVLNQSSTPILSSDDRGLPNSQGIVSGIESYADKFADSVRNNPKYTVSTKPVEASPIQRKIQGIHDQLKTATYMTASVGKSIGNNIKDKAYQSESYKRVNSSYNKGKDFIVKRMDKSKYSNMPRKNITNKK